MAVDCTKLKELGYQSVDDLPTGMLAGLDDQTLATIYAELPSRKVTVQATAIDYGKGKFPSRAALIAAASQIDAEYGEPGYAARESARQVWMQAMGGNLQAWDRVTDRLDGKPQAELAMAPGTEMAVQYVIRGPAVCKTREEFCQLTGSVVSPDVESG